MAGEQLEITSEGDVTIARFVDQRITDDLSLKQFGDELSSLASSGEHKKLLLNFENVEFLSSAALGKLISVKKKAAQSGTRLILCSIRPVPFQSFEITNLDKVFEIADDQEAAFSMFA